MTKFRPFWAPFGLPGGSRVDQKSVRKWTPKNIREDAKMMPKSFPDGPKVIPSMSKKCQKVMIFGAMEVTHKCVPSR